MPRWQAFGGRPPSLPSYVHFTPIDPPLYSGD